jgi:hypothetical protein
MTELRVALKTQLSMLGQLLDWASCCSLSCSCNATHKLTSKKEFPQEERNEFLDNGL